MDDFIHNLRTGKNKPFDRNRKQFDNNAYKNSDRQSSGDNRRKDSFQRSHHPDNFPAIKKLLEDIADSQSRLIEINELRAKAEERIAEALEIISSRFLKKKEPVKSLEVESEQGSKVELNTKPVLSRDRILEMIEDMRKEQFSYEKIARSLKIQGIPTLSGKGEWHSQTISRLCQQKSL